MRLSIARINPRIDTAHRSEAGAAGRYIDAREVLKRYLAGRLGVDQAKAFEQACREPEQLQSQLRLARDLGRTTPGEAWLAGGGPDPADGDDASARHRAPRGAATLLARRVPGAIAAFAAGLIVMWQWPPATIPATAPLPPDSVVTSTNTVVVLDPAAAAREAASSVPTVHVARDAALLTLLPAIRSRDPMDWSLELSTTDAPGRWRFRSLDSRRPVLNLPATELTPGAYELRVARANATPDEAKLRVYRFQLSID